MLSTTDTTNHAIRLAADGLQASSTGRFERRSGSGVARPGEALVPDAVERARDGDQDAQRFLYLRYANGIFSYVCSIVNDEYAAEDITQIVFSRLPMRLQRYHASEAPFGTWITRVAYNAAIDHLRSQRAVPCEDVRDRDVWREDVAPDRLGALREALEVLPADQREVLVLRFVLGMSASEVSDHIGRSVLAVHALQHKGRRRLRAELVRLMAAPTVRSAA